MGSLELSLRRWLRVWVERAVGDSPALARASGGYRRVILTVAASYRFFHWSLAFPEVLGEAGPGGFDLVLDDPP